MNILVITNLYPLPWEPNRATFNKQQFDKLSELHQVNIIVPVAWPSYFQNRKCFKLHKNRNVKYVCQWYTPGFFHKYFGYFMYLSILLVAWKWIRHVKPKCVIGSWAFPDGFAAKLIANKLNVPYFIKVHGSDINILSTFEDRKNKIIDVCGSANHVISVSDALKNKLVDLGIRQNKITRIYNGVDPNLFFDELSTLNNDIKKENYPWIFVGNLKKDKGVIDLVKAYSTYKKSGCLRHLIIVGDGAMKEDLKELIDELGLVDRVIMLGALEHSETAELVRKSFCLILPSYHEGVPNVLLEAANCGIPVIATRVGGIPEVVIDNKTGLLIEPGDISAMCKSMLRIEQGLNLNKQDIISHGQQFTWHKNIQVFNDLLIQGTGKN